VSKLRIKSQEEAFLRRFGDAMRPVENVEVVCVEEENCVIVCPNCKDRELHLLKEVITVCPDCGTHFTFRQLNVVYEVEE